MRERCHANARRCTLRAARRAFLAPVSRSYAGDCGLEREPSRLPYGATRSRFKSSAERFLGLRRTLPTCDLVWRYLSFWLFLLVPRSKAAHPTWPWLVERFISLHL